MMKLFKILSSAVLLCVIGALLGGFPTTTGSVKADQPDAVIVTNTPLPVQGTVAATQSGPWNVGITGTPTVNVGNLGSIHLTDNGNPLNVHDVDRPTQQPFSKVGDCAFINVLGQGVCDPANLFVSVPNGKVLVIEDFSGQCVVPGEAAVLTAKLTALDGNGNSLGELQAPVSSTPVRFLVGASGNQVIFGRTTKFYVTQFLGPRITEANSSDGSCTLSLNGYFVNQ